MQIKCAVLVEHKFLLSTTKVIVYDMVQSGEGNFYCVQ